MFPVSLFSQHRLRQRIVESRERLYRVAWSWCHNAALAEDLVQDTMERALKKIGKLRDPQRLEVWLMRIQVNLFRDHLRRNREETSDEIEVESPECGPDMQAQQHELVLRTRAAIERLPDNQRQVLTLVDLSELSYADTAQVLDVPIGTVMSRLSRARARLRELMLKDVAMPKQGNVVSLAGRKGGNHK